MAFKKSSANVRCLRLLGFTQLCCWIFTVVRPFTQVVVQTSTQSIFLLERGQQLPFWYEECFFSLQINPDQWLPPVDSAFFWQEKKYPFRLAGELPPWSPLEVLITTRRLVQDESDHTVNSCLYLFWSITCRELQGTGVLFYSLTRCRIKLTCPDARAD